MDVKLNFKSGIGAKCLDAIVREEDKHAARERIKEEKEEGSNIESQMKEWKSISSGKFCSSGNVRLGQSALAFVQAQIKAKQAKQRDTYYKKVGKWEAMMKSAAEVKALNKPFEKLTGPNLKALLKPLKRDEDPAIPNKKEALRKLYKEWENREPVKKPTIGDVTLPEAIDDDDEALAVGDSAEV